MLAKLVKTWKDKKYQRSLSQVSWYVAAVIQDTLLQHNAHRREELSIHTYSSLLYCQLPLTFDLKNFLVEQTKSSSTATITFSYKEELFNAFPSKDQHHLREHFITQESRQTDQHELPLEHSGGKPLSKQVQLRLRFHRHKRITAQKRHAACLHKHFSHPCDC